MRTFACAMFGAIAAFTAPVLAEPNTPSWGRVVGWDIRVDPTLGNGCFAAQNYQRGSVVRIGVNPNDTTVYFLFGNEAWTSLQVGRTYAITFVFDGVATYTGEMTGYSISGSTFLVHNNVSSRFVNEFMQRNAIEIFYRDERIANLSLRNTYAAVTEVVNCQRALIAAGKSNLSASGRSSSSSGNDPFRRNDPFK
jgi:hypothetical protein